MSLKLNKNEKILLLAVEAKKESPLTSKQEEKAAKKLAELGFVNQDGTPGKLYPLDDCFDRHLKIRLDTHKTFVFIDIDSGELFFARRRNGSQIWDIFPYDLTVTQDNMGAPLTHYTKTRIDQFLVALDWFILQSPPVVEEIPKTED